jgi:serine-type D-Ala-D-Ala carboxypeptidase (penicillin-binding protein 5/6)
MRPTRRGTRRAFLTYAVAGAALLAVRGLTAPAAAQQPLPASRPFASTSDSLPPPVTARAAAVVDGDSGALLLNKNAFRPMAPASVTKILTALVALQHVDPKQRVTARFDRSELDPDGTAMGLLPGDQVTVEDLLYGLMLPSGNDAALVLARTVAGSEVEFVAMMNRAAAANGLDATTFVNAHGLDQPGHRTSAHDIAQIGRLAMRDPRFRTIVRARSWTVVGRRTYEIFNRNAFLREYPGADGIKIGWTEDAGATIVASAVRHGRRMIVALMNTADRVGECSALMDWAFDTFDGGGTPIAVTVTD